MGPLCDDDDLEASALPSYGAPVLRPEEHSRRTHTSAQCSRLLLDVRHGDGRNQHTAVFRRPQDGDEDRSPRAFFGLVDREIASVDVASVERTDCGGALFGRSHLDKAEPARAAGVTVRDHLGLGYLAVLGE